MSVKHVLRKSLKSIQQNGLQNTFQRAQRRVFTKLGVNKVFKRNNAQLHDLYVKLIDLNKSQELKGLVILTSGREFEELYNQRTINLAKYLSDQGFAVLFVAWQWDDQEKLEKSYQQVYKNIFQIPVYDFIYDIEKLKVLDEFAKKTYITTFPAKLFYGCLGQLNQSNYKIVYDIMDEWEEFYKTGDAPWYNRSIEEAFVQHSNLVTVVSQPLKDKFASIRNDIYVIGNGYNAALSGKRNVSLKQAAPDNKIHIGYFGHMTPSWFDWDLIFALAKNQQFVFHFIGHGATDEILSKIEALPNCEFYGKVHPSKLQQFVEKWNIGIIPFKTSKLSDAVDPIKIYEYLYFGLPTVSTGIPHIGKYPLVTHCDTEAEARAAILHDYKQLIHAKLPYGNLDAFLAKTTWDERFKEILHVLDTK
ncbi:glycosyltransferase [Paenibacillus sp. BSR1-1]|uniref:glycosyltransferase n=1 Tax=Paenibacillus sp. BSR1-1 TaxID=3020845 RepID=UPI0025B1CABB|nr:glycosyltransferase [Paenibacillus sp. BSR1-1]MDN3019009.1 glycosyltransferase [Paenibacillus sp. BSR1-1]